MASHTLTAKAPSSSGRSATVRALRRRPWAVALAVAIPLAAAYLIAAPPAADLAAATYRSSLFARVGFSSWDTGWYAAHGYWLPSYSLLSPVLGWLLGVRALLAISALAASALFALIAERIFSPSAARVSAAWFALGFCVGLLSGRVPYDLGFAIGLGAVLAVMRGSLPVALALAALTSLASPVAGAFLALAGLAYALAPLARTADGQREERRRRKKRGIALASAALAPILILGLAYPNGGYEPFAASAFWPALAGVALIGALLPQGPLTPTARTAVRLGAALYALALIGAYAIHTPMGGNATRLGPLLAAPLLAGVMWDDRRALLLALTPLLLYWQLVTPIRDVSSLAGNPSVNASYYTPLLAELHSLLAAQRSRTAPEVGYRSASGRPSTIVEVPLTASHWEAAYVAGHDGISLARGWERQLDTRYGAIFYRPTLSAAAYRAWLLENRVAYVALPGAPLDKAGRLEGALVAHGLPYLRELWHSGQWRLYRFMG